MKRVIFVDDEENVLQGLKVMLHSMRSAWELEIAKSGPEALEMMETQGPFDVVVTDVQMPGMNGNEFLHRVKDAYPQSVRIVLTGAPDSETVFQAATIAHQYLFKPCEPHQLRNLISRAFALREHLRNNKLRESLMDMGALPSIPKVFQEVTLEMHSPDPTVGRVGEIIERDPGMSAKVLQVVNSAHVGLRHRVTSVTQAASLLGMNNLRTLVLMTELFEPIDKKKLPAAIKLDDLWEHCLTVGAYAKLIAETEIKDRKVMDDSYTAGLLHDVGLLILATAKPDTLVEAINCAKENSISLFEAERRVFEGTHAEVGGFLLELWGIPDPVIEAITFHNFPSSIPTESYSLETEDSFTALTAVHVANYIAGEGESGEDLNMYAELDVDHLNQLKLTEKLSYWVDLCLKESNGDEK